jgi:hypothetical protein
MMAEYHYTIRKVVWEIPLSVIFAIAPARAMRNGSDLEGFTDAAAGRAREKAKSFFEENYKIIP